MLRPGSAARLARCLHLHLRMHVLPRLRVADPRLYLPELRRRTRPAPGSPSRQAGEESSFDSSCASLDALQPAPV